MDVRCESCQTVYEFDEARVKEGGVTVKCTQCGHIFKVRKRSEDRTVRRTLSGVPGVERSEVSAPRPAAPTAIPGENSGRGAPVEDRAWLLRSAASGDVRRFRELTSLQQWIVEKKVGRDDEISRTGDQWKRLGAIPELSSFFRVVEQAEGRSVAAGGVEVSVPRGDPALYGTGPMPPVTPGLGIGVQAAPGPDPFASTIPSPISRVPSGPTEWSNPEPEEEEEGFTAPHDRADADDLDIPRRRLPGSVLLAATAVLILVGVTGYVAIFKRAALKGILAGDEGGRGREAYRKGREYFLLDTDEDFKHADQHLQRAQGADEANALPVAGLVQVNVTWARYLRDEADHLDKSEAAKADELRKAARAHLDDARRYANEARTLAGDDPDVNLAVAELLTLDGAPAAQVEEHLQRSEARRADDPEVAFARAVLLLRESKADEARTWLERSNRLSQQQTRHDLLRADFLLARMAATGGRADEARTAALRILEANPHHLRARALLASLDVPAPPAPPAAPAPAPAAPAVVVAAPAPPAPAPAPAPAAEPAGGEAAGEPKEKPAKAEPHGYDGLVAAGNRLLEYGKGKEAIKIFEKALLAQPDGVDALLGLGYADLDTEHFSAAVDKFKRVLTVSPSNGDAIIGLAETYKARGDKPKALEYYQRYVKDLPAGSKAPMAQTNVRELQAEAAKANRPTATELQPAAPIAPPSNSQPVAPTDPPP